MNGGFLVTKIKQLGDRTFESEVARFPYTKICEN